MENTVFDPLLRLPTQSCGVFFFRNQLKCQLGSLRKTPMEGTPPQAQVPCVVNWPKSYNTTTQSHYNTESLAALISLVLASLQLLASMRKVRECDGVQFSLSCATVESSITCSLHRVAKVGIKEGMSYLQSTVRGELQAVGNKALRSSSPALNLTNPPLFMLTLYISFNFSFSVLEVIRNEN